MMDRYKSRILRPSSVLGAACVSIACASVLDISDPPLRDPEGGASGGGASNAGASALGGAGIGQGGAGNRDAGGEAGLGAAGRGGTGIGGAGEGGMAGGTAGDAGAGDGGQSGGAGGDDSGEPCPSVGQQRCGGASGKVPEICGASLHWAANPEENAGQECAIDCVAGGCTECETDERRCGSDLARFSDYAQACENGSWGERTYCPSHCSAGSCAMPPSCNGALSCVPEQAANESCCRSLRIPGGSFSRSFDETENFADDSFRATISTFWLDRFEVTVGRFRNFVAAYPGSRPEPGAGRHPKIQGAAWLESFELPADRDALEAELVACDNHTWTETPGANERRPMNCVGFALAYAFCIWDGGRLPTEAEWNYAAAGGEEQRVYPWSEFRGDTSISDEHAVFGQIGGLPARVGSKTERGLSRWGQDDLAGNVYEWTLDWYQEPYRDLVCADCADLAPATDRVLRGGSYRNHPSNLTTSERVPIPFDATSEDYGFRCARDPSNTFID